MSDALHDLLRRRALSHPNSTFLCFKDSLLSFATCDHLVSALAQCLAQCGVRPHSFVAVWSTNRPEFVISYFAVLRAGGIVVPLNPKLAPAELRYILADANISLVLHPPDLTFPIPAPQISALSTPYCSISATLVPPELRGAPPSFPSSLNSIAVCIYTSGTTGRPKGALLSHAALAANAHMCAAGLKSRPNAECFVTVLPLFHAFAASACMLHATLIAARLLLLDQFHPQELFRLMAAHQATVFMGVPAMYAVLASIENPPHIPSWRLSVSGGAPLPLAVYENFLRRYHMPIHEGDGPTECGPATSINPVDGPVKPGTIGLPLPGVHMRIVDDNLTELPTGHIGEIIVQSPSNFSAYLNQPEETSHTLINGWVRTGDLGFRDEDGYFSIVDRKKDMLIVAGLNVYPRELEDYIRQHHAVADVAVIGIHDPTRGELPAACIVLRPGTSLTLAELRSFLRSRVAPYKIPRRIFFLDALPRNATGKVLKTTLRATFANNPSSQNS
ncbi:MAG: AMP-binding protein [bacterium]|nr:AMP-binding protein [bacterium]